MGDRNYFQFALREYDQDRFFQWLFSNWACDDNEVRNACHALISKLADIHLMSSEIQNLEVLYQKAYSFVGPIKSVELKPDFTLVLRLADVTHLLLVEDKINAEFENDFRGYEMAARAVEKELAGPKNASPIVWHFKVLRLGKKIPVSKKRLGNFEILEKDDVLPIFEPYKHFLLHDFYVSKLDAILNRRLRESNKRDTASFFEEELQNDCPDYVASYDGDRCISLKKKGFTFNFRIKTYFQPCVKCTFVAEPVSIKSLCGIEDSPFEICPNNKRLARLKQNIRPQTYGDLKTKMFEVLKYVVQELSD